MEVIVMKVKRKEGGAMVTGVIGAGLGPFAGDGLDEALGLAVGLGAVGLVKRCLMPSWRQAWAKSLER